MVQAWGVNVLIHVSVCTSVCVEGGGCSGMSRMFRAEMSRIFSRDVQWRNVQGCPV